MGEFLGQLSSPHLIYPRVNGYKDIIIILDDRDNPPENEVWHSGLTFYKEPSFASILQGIEIPKRGGDTLFADMTKIAHDLSDEIKSFLRNLSAIHSLKLGFKFVSDFNQIERVKVLKESDLYVNSAKHPVLKIHPISGEENLFVNSAYTKHICELNSSESEMLIKYLNKLVEDSQFKIRVKREEGTVVIWDNWATQYYACGDHFPSYLREVQRVTVQSPHFF